MEDAAVSTADSTDDEITPADQELEIIPEPVLDLNASVQKPSVSLLVVPTVTLEIFYWLFNFAVFPDVSEPHKKTALDINFQWTLLKQSRSSTKQ